jgi:large subunit ribosomal protein L15
MSLTLHTLSNTPGARKTRMRVGRGIGSGKGKTCGKGHKGQMARKGHKRKLGFEGGQMRLIRRLPKRGFKSRSLQTLAVVNVGDLRGFEPGGEVTRAALRARRIVSGAVGGVKILGGGDIDRALMVRAQAFSASARAKIVAAGGVCEVVRD